MSGDGSLDYAKAHQIVSTYGLNAMEAAARLAAANEGSKSWASRSAVKIDDSKTKKNVLARGIDQLYMTADDACADLDAGATAAALAESSLPRWANMTSSSAATALLTTTLSRLTCSWPLQLGLPSSMALPRLKLATAL